MSEAIRGAIARAGVALAKRVIRVHANGRVLITKMLARDKFVVWCA